MKLDPEPVLEADDIQGHILVGFGSAPQAVAAYTANDLAAAARAVGTLAARGIVTSAAELRAVRGNRSAREVIAGSGPWVTISVSHRLLQAAGVPALFDDPWFTSPAGMPGVTSLHDPLPSAGGRIGMDWVAGGPGALIDVLVLTAAGTEKAAVDVVDVLESLIDTAWISSRFRESLCPMQGNIEHFGFRDGISQPALLGTVAGEPLNRDRILGSGPIPFARPGQELVWPGEFVFGYPQVEPSSGWIAGPTAQVDDPATAAVARNGAYLVYRRLAQDVPAFRAFCSEQAEVLRPCMGDDLTPERVAALLVGRHPNGVPVARDVTADAHDDEILNGFSFHDDDMAAACPAAAHIRKVNPRRGASDVDRVPRILRRGAPFGPPFADGESDPPGGRGLAFVCYQTSIVQQFGFLMRSWLGDSIAPNGGGGHDLLVGQVDASNRRVAELRGADEEPCRVDAGHRTWVRQTGGAFLFTPSLTLLNSLA